MYFIVQGHVCILAGDKQTVVARLGKGQYFGEIAIIDEKKDAEEILDIVEKLSQFDSDKDYVAYFTAEERAAATNL